jgi:hypothetical protein
VSSLLLNPSFGVLVLAWRTVGAEQPHPRGELVVAGQHRARIPIRAKVFPG